MMLYDGYILFRKGNKVIRFGITGSELSACDPFTIDLDLYCRINVGYLDHVYKREYIAPSLVIELYE